MTTGTGRTPRKETGSSARSTAKPGPDGSVPDDSDEVAKLKEQVAELAKRVREVERALDESRSDNKRLVQEYKELKQKEDQEDELQRILAVTDEGERARRLAKLSSEERKLYVKLRMESG